MTTADFLLEYSGQSLDQLLSMETTHRVDSLVLAMESALDQKLAERGDESLSAEERVILVVEALEREVNNGGYDQFFINPSATYADEVENALHTIGCPKHAALTARAIAALKIEGPVTHDSVAVAIHRDDDKREEALNSARHPGHRLEALARDGDY